MTEAMTAHRALAIALVTACLLVASCGSSREASVAAKVDPLFATWTRPDSPGCGIGVSRNGVLIFERGYGLANLERRAPITASTVFHLASITKSFTAMSVLLAAERGVLSLDDEVSKYVPDWSARVHKVTIRHLLTHTSGVRDAYVLQGWAPNNGNTTDAFLKILARQRGLNFAPGAEYQYNNGGYLLLGTILARASGHTLGAFADANIFKPLGMTGAWFNGDPVRAAPDHASGYSPQEKGWRLVPESSGYAGNAGMMSSVRDLLLWANNFADVRVGTPTLLASMQTASVLTSGQATQSGMGFGISNYRGARTFRTSGGDRGVATELVLFPDQKAAIAVLCNMDSVVMGGLATVNPDDLTNGLANVFLEDVLEKRSTVVTAASAPIASTSAPVQLSPDDVAGKSGLYRLGPDENHIVSMSVRDGRFGVWDYYGDNYHLLMTPISANRFTLPGATLEFSPAEAGRARAWHIVDGGGQRLLELPSVTFDVPKAELGAFAGAYRSEELDVVYTVSMRDSSLVLQSSTLYPVSKDAFVGDYMGAVRFFRDQRGLVSGFTLNRQAARGVRFERVAPTPRVSSAGSSPLAQAR
jgi:CubicO group peptidase (beta-lactamase class C family)